MQYVNYTDKGKVLSTSSKLHVRQTNPHSGDICHDFRLTWEFSDIGEDIAGEEAHAEHAREVTVVTAAFALQMECVILLQVGNIRVHGHLTQERIGQDVFVVDLRGVGGQ